MRNTPRGEKKTSRKRCFKAFCILCHPTFNKLDDWFGCLPFQEIKFLLQIRKLSLTICSVPIFQGWEWAWKQIPNSQLCLGWNLCCATPLKCTPWLERQQGWAPQQPGVKSRKKIGIAAFDRRFCILTLPKKPHFVSRYYSWSVNPAESGQKTLGKEIHGLSNTLINTMVFTPLSHLITFQLILTDY